MVGWWNVWYMCTYIYLCVANNNNNILLLLPHLFILALNYYYYLHSNLNHWTVHAVVPVSKICLYLSRISRLRFSIHLPSGVVTIAKEKTKPITWHKPYYYMFFRLIHICSFVHYFAHLFAFANEVRNGFVGIFIESLIIQLE